MKFPASKVSSDPRRAEHALFNLANQEWDAGNIKKAFYLLNLAACEGDVHAFNSIGYFFDNGIGVQKDQGKALFWYKKAARNLDLCSYINIGLIYRDVGNIRRAKFWLSKAVDEGDGDAALELAKLYLRVKGNKNIDAIVKCLQMASKSESITITGREEADLLLQATRASRTNRT